MPAPTRHDPPWRFDNGGSIITGTDTVTGIYKGLQALTTCTLDSGTVASDLTGTLTGLTIPAGATVWASFTSIQLSAGTAVAYR
jgi:hypothetical protein